MLQILSMLLLSAASSSAQRLLDRKFPNYIIPVDSSQPNTAFGTQFSGHIVRSPPTHLEVRASADMSRESGMT